MKNSSNISSLVGELKNKIKNLTTYSSFYKKNGIALSAAAIAVVGGISLGNVYAAPLPHTGVNIEQTYGQAIADDPYDTQLNITIVDGKNGGNNVLNLVVPREGLKKVFQDYNIKLGPLDKVSPDLSTQVKADEVITITRIETSLSLNSSKIPFSSSKQSDAVDCDDATATDKVVTTGVDGEKVDYVSTTTVNGEPKDTILKTDTTKEAVNEVKADCKPKATPTPTPSSTPTKNSSNNSAPKASSDPTATASKSSSGNGNGNSSSTSSSSSTPVTYSGSHTDWMAAAGISPSDYNYVNFIVTKESNWNYKAVNPSSGATGLCQALPGQKMSSAGSDWATNPVTQLKWCSGYAQQRYGGWSGAYQFWLAHNWW